MAILVAELRMVNSIFHGIRVCPLEVGKARTRSSAEVVQGGFTVRHPIRIVKVVHIDPDRARLCFGDAFSCAVSALYVDWFQRHTLFQRFLEYRKHCSEFDLVQNNLHGVEWLVGDRLRGAVRLRDGTFLCTLMHIGLEPLHERLHSDERRDAVRPGCSTFVHIHMRQEQPRYSDSILDRGQVLPKLRRERSLVLIPSALSNGQRLAVEERPP